MEYISAEEFLKQPKEVQKVFLDWWEPSLGNLINKKVWIHGREYNKVGCFDYEWWHDLQDSEDWDIYNKEDIKQFVLDYIGDFPLLTEGQLRKFIEDKLGCKIDFDYLPMDNGYRLNRSDCCEDYEGLGEDLLQAYWKVALQIAEDEEIKED